MTYWRVMGSTFERRRNRLERSQAEIVGLLSDIQRVERGRFFVPNGTDWYWRVTQATEFKSQIWCARLGSNQQPLPSEGSTLSIELRALQHESAAT